MSRAKITSNSLLSKDQQDSLWRWAERYAPKNIPIIWSEQDAPRPDRAHITLRFLNGPLKNGYDEQRICDDGSYIISGDRRFTLSINTYGRGALNIMAHLQNTLEWPPVLEHFKRSGLAPIEDLGVQNLTTLIESTHEERAQMDITFAYAQNDAMDEGSIDNVGLDSTLTGKDTHNEKCDI